MLNLLKNKRKKALPVEPSNVLLISSSAKDLWEVVELVKSKYTINCDNPYKLDNGDFAIVVKNKKG